MISLEMLCEKIKLQDPIKKQVELIHQTINYDNMSTQLNGLFKPEAWDEAVKALIEKLGDDPDGLKMLTCMLSCALQTHSFYKSKGIPESIYYQTMLFFTNAINEHFVTYGRYGFDRGSWTVRHISGMEYRIGILEYEMFEEDGIKGIGMHIPTNTQLNLENLRHSYLEARKFFAMYFSDYADADMFCSSWLMSPALKDLLPATSNIIQFQRSFELQDVDYESNAFMVWVFKKRGLPLEELPEDTSLQKNVKKYLLNGGKIGWANAKLINEPFIK